MRSWSRGVFAKTWRRSANLRRSIWGARLCLLIVIALWSPPPAWAALRVRVGIYQNSPKVAVSEVGKPEGIFVDLIEAIAADEGWSIEYVPGTWSQGLDRLAAGEIDLMPDVALTQAREAVYAFHREPVLSDWFQVYTRRGSGIRSVLDLNGKRVSLLERSIQQEALEKATLGFDLNLTLVPLPDYRAAFAAVARGEADAVIANRFYGTAHVRESQLEDTAIIFNPTRLYFAAPRPGNPALLKAIDRHLTRWKSNPGSPYHRSLQRWTSEDLRLRFPGWVKGVGIGAAGLLLFSFFWSVVLKHQVAARTRELALSNQRLQATCEQRERAEQAIRQSEERFRLITENLKDLVAVLDQDGRRLYNSPSYRSILGDPDGLRGSCSFEQIHPDDRERVQASFQDTVRTGIGRRLEYRLMAHDGQVRHIESQGSVIRDEQGQVAKVLVVSRDVTERQRTEEARRESERKYRELVEHANSIILRWTRDGRILFLNEFGQRFFGYTETEICGRHVIGTIVPETESSGRDLPSLMDQLCANPAAFEQNVNVHMRRNGERVWIAWTNKVVLDAQGQVVEILSIGTDITARMRIEEELRSTQATLEERVLVRTTELAEARDRAEEADRVKSAFLATMSHELRTPLNSIIGFTGILLQGLAGPLNSEQNKQLEMVRTSARHLLALINDVLDISKIEAGQLQVTREPFDLRASIAKVVGLVRPLAEKKVLALHVRLSPELGRIVSDARRVEQILLNLLNNAIKFTEQGHVTLTAEIVAAGVAAGFQPAVAGGFQPPSRTRGAHSKEPAALPAGSRRIRQAEMPAATFATTATGNLLRISVADTGIGIQPEDLAKLFQPFRQIDTGLTRNHEGTGLGLAICRRLTDLLGGEICAESEWQQGSEFTVTLPLRAAPEANQTPGIRGVQGLP